MYDSNLISGIDSKLHLYFLQDFDLRARHFSREQRSNLWKE